MTTYFISRHPGAIEWAIAVGIRASHVEHLDPAVVEAGDRVIGTLPVNLAAQVCQRGARYWHLSLQLPRSLRGVELSREQLEALSPLLVEYRIVAGESVPSDVLSR